jgi:antitoxin component YwqK of YwqJK toxin-antitoxin module
MAILLLLSSFILFSPQQQSLRQILDPFNANWRGEFKVYNFDGKLIDQLEVEQRYSWKGDEQHGEFVERYRNGKVARARARNYAKDGQLFCEVEKDTGERTVHLGRFEDGVLFWYRQTPDGKITESFKERVVKTPAGREYQIDGLGIYKNDGSASVLLFEGRYREVK